MSDPLTPYLLDIMSDPAASDLILAGGLGMLHKQRYLQQTGLRTLLEEIPPARATTDIDLVLRVELWASEGRAPALRELLEQLGYNVHQYNWQFIQKHAAGSGAGIKVDLMARPPVSGETVKAREGQVGRGMGTGIGAYLTPEAFAVEYGAIPIEIAGTSASGRAVSGLITVPHPYAWINMKVQAGYDWLRQQRDEIDFKPRREKHVFDVYVLGAMLTQPEMAQASQYVEVFADHPIAQEIKEHAVELFGTPDSPGSIEAQRQCGPTEFHYEEFWEATRMVLGL